MSETNQDTKSDYLQFLEDKYVDEQSEVRAMLASSAKSLTSLTQKELKLVRSSVDEELSKMRMENEEAQKRLIKKIGFLSILAIATFGVMCGFVGFVVMGSM